MSRFNVCVVIALVLALIAPLQAQIDFLDETFAFDAEQPAVGTWVGNLTMPGDTGRIAFATFSIVESDAGLVVKSMTFLTIGAMNEDGGSVEADQSSMVFSMTGAGGEYEFKGVISSDGQRYTGQLNRKAEDDPDAEPVEFEFARSVRPFDLPEAMAFRGDLSIQTMKIGMTIVLAQTPGGNWVGHLDVPLQGVNALPVVNLKRVDDVLSGELPIPGGASFEVSFAAQRSGITGVFKQSGMTFDIDFGLDANYAFKEITRPQEPQPPYPYETREIELEHPDGFAIAGTLTLPETSKFGAGPHPVAVMITGSGQQDRDESLLGHKPFLVIADYLTRNGIAVMRCDDRGVGGTGGRETLETATSLDFATDVLAVVEHLKTINEVDGERIGLIGHSEGGLIAPIVGTMTDDIAFMVLMAGPGVSGRELLGVQRTLLTVASGASEAMAARQNEGVEKLIDLLLAGGSEDELVAEAMAMARERMPGMDVDEARLESEVRGEMSQLTSAWMRYFLAYDPTDALQSVQCPVLAINGTKDLQVWHEQNLDAIDRILTEVGADVTAKRYEGLNHLFQPAVTGSVAEYSQIEITFDETVLRDMVEWINAKVR